MKTTEKKQAKADIATWLADALRSGKQTLKSPSGTTLGTIGTTAPQVATFTVQAVSASGSVAKFKVTVTEDHA